MLPFTPQALWLPPQRAVIASPGIAFVNAADLGRTLAVSSVTASYTCGSGANRLLVVGVLGDASSDLITGVTYGGVSMILSDKHQPGIQRWSYLYYLLGPAAGSNNVVVSASTTTAIYVGAADYTGVKSSGQPDAHTTHEFATSISTLTTSITTVTNNDWTVLFENGYNGSPAPTNGTGSTIKASDATDGAWGLYDSNGVITPAGSYSMTTNRTSASNNGIGHLVAAFQPA
jgi:hypothetical protein